jgi:hypothetical protein
MLYICKTENVVFELQEIVYMWEQGILTPSTVGMRVHHNHADPEMYILFSIHS